MSGIFLRKILGVIRCTKDHGICYTVRYGMKKIKKRVCIDARSLLIRIRQRIGGITPLVSIILPVYNGEDYIEQAIDSLLNQTVKHFEIIVIDDGSTDASLEILRSYEKKDKRVRVYTQENKFAGVARNLGIEKARGEYLAFLDSDDFFASNLVEDAYYAAKMNNVDMVLFGAKIFNNVTGQCEEAKWLLNTELTPKEQVFNYKDCSENLYRITTPCAWTKLFRRKFILHTGLRFQPLQNTNDLFFTYVALAMADKITVLDKELVYYRVGTKNNLQAKKGKNPLCFYSAYKAWYDKLIELKMMDTLGRSYVNTALIGCIYELESQNDLHVKKLIFDKLKTEFFNELGIWGYDISYYYDKSAYSVMELIKNVSFDEYIKRVF